ncbi:non-ribosomal peptide synthetase [Halodesulfovibrio aestuarii]|uniref:Polyketide synthase PksJ n=1 Tax=Halodesulfovibrio aestuarii TaxID=126333 RepID=A0A8G2CBH0_9BACT|nr:non-ribosomal peptide synthetase [Halodesulfovibrio aestuarii]SHJ55948.1 polyketide synthase PksJ [Halodesulfovibrio aestuarii]
MTTAYKMISEPLEESLIDILERTALTVPDKGIYHVDRDGTGEQFQSYADLLREATQVGKTLYQKGLKPKDHLLLAVESSKNFLNLFWGCLLTGIIPVPLAHVRTPNDASMEVQKVLGVQQLLQAPVVSDSHNDRTFSTLKTALAEQGGTLLASEDILSAARLTDSNEPDFYRAKFDELAVLQFSSGSTGMPKGARLTHRNLIANILALIDIERVDNTDTLVSWLPYFHDFGLFGCHLMPLYAGINQVKMDPFQFAQRPFLWMQKIHEHRATLTSSTNTGIEHLAAYIGLKKDKLPELNLSCIKSFIMGAEMVSIASCKKLEDQLESMNFPKLALMPGYGLTETTLVACCTRSGDQLKSFLINRKKMISEGVIEYEKTPSEHTAEFACVGTSVPHCRLRIVDTEGNELPANRVGLIEIQGENVVNAYEKNPDANTAAFHDSWFSSGDMGFMTENNEACIVGRQKEILVIHGQNYYPADVEKIALLGHEEKFRLAVVCGAYDEKLGKEKVLLFYVKNKKELSAENTPQTLTALRENVSNLAGFPIDHFIPVTQGEIPRTSSGKVIRSALAQAFLDGSFDGKTAETDAMLTAQNKGIDYSALDHESIVRNVWQEILELETSHLTPNKSMFKLGADSIRAMRIQGLLEETYQAKMESNFCYMYQTIAAQVAYFKNRDFSIEPPQNELESIILKIVAEQLEAKPDTIGVTENLVKRMDSISELLTLLEEIKKVFKEVPIEKEFLEFNTIRQMANYLNGHVFSKNTEEQEYDIFPLMHFQETLYFHRKGFVRNEPSGLSCYIFLKTNLTGKMNLELFDKALNYVVSRHPVLRSVIDEEDNRPRMKSLNTVPEVHTSYLDISGKSVEEQRQFILNRGLEHNDYRFDLSQFPLFFCELLKVNDERHVFMINIDHLLIDGFSFMQVFEELFNTYDKMLRNEPHELPEASMTFGDYVRVEQLRQRTAEYKNALEFQLDIFKNLPPKAVLPFKQNPATLEKVQFDTFYQEIEPEIIEALNAVAMENQVSLNSLLLAAYFKLMSIWCHQDDLIINMPVFNREQYFAGARKTVATFIDIFPVRLQTYFEEPLIQIAQKAEEFTRRLLEVPVSSIELSRELFEREGLRATSMSSIIFSNSIGMYNGEVSEMQKIMLDTPEFRTGAPGTYIDLVIYDFRERKHSADTFYFNWNFIRDIFDKDFIEILSSQYKILLTQLVKAKSSEYAAQKFTGEEIIPEHHRKLMGEINNTKTSFPDATLHALIEEQVRKTPDKEALTFEGNTLTYSMFNEQAAAIGRCLTSLNIGNDDFVALFTSRSLEMLTGQFGVLKAGAAYLPIDIDYPSDRIAYVLEDSLAPVLLTQSTHLPRLEGALKHVKHVILLDEGADTESIPESIKDKTVTLNSLKEQSEGIELPEVSTCDLAYMIYTSGSTGKPKGVQVTHRNIVNFLHWVKMEVNIREEERLALVTSYAFDMTLTSNWVPFLTGASLHILSEEKTKDVQSLLRFISEREITFLNVTPSHFSLLANAREYLTKEHLPMRDGMRVMQGGELINTKDLNLWLKYYPTHGFINEYGPTETTVASTFFPISVTEKNTVELHTVPIGKPVYNTQIYIMNDDLKNCMIGVPGELCIGGEGVTNGYYNNAVKTAEAFIQNPYGPEGDLLYRTGDVVRLLNDGNIEFLGRNDHQINLRGYRIEAGEIENTIREHGQVAEAVVVPQKDTADSLALVAFYTSTNGQIPPKELRTHLAETLPEYMIPVHFEHLETMPCTPSGKLDKKSLPKVTIEAGAITDDSAKPETELEIQVAEIWEEVLGVTGIGLNSNFWEIGGDSLKAMRLIMRMKKEGFINFGLKEAFEYQTVGSIVEHMLSTQKETEEKEADIVNLTYRQYPVAQLFCLPYACGNPTMYRELSDLLPADYAISAANMPGHGNSGKPFESIPQIAEHFVPLLSEKQQDTPLFIVGYSFGGHAAYALAKLLEEKGTPAAGVIIISSPPPEIKGGLKAILSSTDDEIMTRSKEVYKYDFTDMTASEQKDYLHTLKIDTKAMVDFTFTRKLNTPAINIAGRNEEEQSIRSEARLWRNAFKHCELKELNGAHMLIKTNAKELAKLISSFVDVIALENGGGK